MKLRMKVTQNGSPDGYEVYAYQAGGEYSLTSTPPLSNDLAAVFLREGWAEEIAEAPFRESESAPAVAPEAPAPPTPELAVPPAAPATPPVETAAAVSEAAVEPPTPAAEPPMEAPAAESPAKSKKSAAPPNDPAPGSSEPS